MRGGGNLGCCDGPWETPGCPTLSVLSMNVGLYTVSVLLCTLSLRMAGCSPQNGRVGKPGFGGLSFGLGRGVIVMPPVSINKINNR